MNVPTTRRCRSTTTTACGSSRSRSALNHLSFRIPPPHTLGRIQVWREERQFWAEYDEDNNYRGWLGADTADPPPQWHVALTHTARLRYRRRPSRKSSTPRRPSTTHSWTAIPCSGVAIAIDGSVRAARVRDEWHLGRGRGQVLPVRRRVCRVSSLPFSSCVVPAPPAWGAPMSLRLPRQRPANGALMWGLR